MARILDLSLPCYDTACAGRSKVWYARVVPNRYLCSTHHAYHPTMLEIMHAKTSSQKQEEGWQGAMVAMQHQLTVRMEQTSYGNFALTWQPKYDSYLNCSNRPGSSSNSLLMWSSSTSL